MTSLTFYFSTFVLCHWWPVLWPPCRRPHLLRHGLAWLFISHLPCCVIDDPYYDLLADGCTFCVMTSLTLYLTFRVTSLMTRIMTSLPTAAPFASWLAWLFISHLPCCVVDDPYYDLLANSCTFCVMTSLTFYFSPSVLCHWWPVLWPPCRRLHLLRHD